MAVCACTSVPLSLYCTHTHTGCNFTSNLLTSTAGAALGGGLVLQFSGDASGSAVEVQDCRFDGNQLTSSDAAIGGGMTIVYFDSASDARLSVAGTTVVVVVLLFVRVWRSLHTAMAML